MMLFFKVFFTEFIAEMGDKTQLMLIALTSKYKLRDIILGTAAAILVLNGLAVLAGGLVSEFIPDWLIKMIAALAFLYFAASTLAGDDDEEEEEDEDEDEADGEPEEAELPPPMRRHEPKLGFWTLLGAALLGASGDDGHGGRCTGDCAHCPPHFGYRYGRWYYGHGHVYGCEFGGNRGDGYD